MRIKHNEMNKLESLQKETNGINRSVAALPALLGDKGLLLHHGCGFYGAESVVFSAIVRPAEVRRAEQGP